MARSTILTANTPHRAHRLRVEAKRGSVQAPNRVTLNDVTVDLDTGVVDGHGMPERRLQYQPLLVLRSLVSHAGRVVTREELQAAVWPSETHVDFEHGLNYCVRQLRAALSDDSRTPVFIETVPRRGYRLIAKVAHEPTITANITADAQAHVPVRRRAIHAPLWVGSLALLVGAFLVVLARDATRQPVLSSVPIDVRSDTHTASPKAWDSFVRARALLTRVAGSDVDDALRLLDQAIAADAAFAAAHAARADALVLAAVLGYRPARPTLASADRAVTTALALAPAAPGALATAATIRFRLHWDWIGAEQLFARARALPGGGAAVPRDHAWFLAAMGRRAEAVQAIHEALALDPSSARINADAAWILTRARRYEEAIDQVGRALSIEPGLPGLRACLECAYANSGRAADAVEAIKATAPPGTTLQHLPADPREALTRLEGHRLEAVLRERRHDPTTSAYVVAVQAAAAGDDRAATHWLKRALVERDPGLAMILADPVWDRLRDELWVAQVTEAIGLPVRPRAVASPRTH